MATVQSNSLFILHTLYHEVFNNAVESRLLVTNSVSPLCQRHKILHSFRRRLAKQSNNNATRSLSINLYVKVNFMSDCGLSSL